MGRPVRKIEGYTIKEIRNLLAKTNDYEVKYRLCAVYQIALGKPSRELEEFYHISHKQILNWVDRFEQSGLDGLKDSPDKGRKSKLSQEQKKKLRDLLKSQSPYDLGYDSEAWNGLLVLDLIKKYFGVTYQRAQVYNLLKSMDFIYLKSKGFYYKAEVIG